MGEKSGSDWTEKENDKVVEEYFAMLARANAGIPFVKAEFNSQVREVTGRSKGAVDYKFRNISAILEPSGHPFVPGYLPARNVQQLLRDRVLEQMAAMEPRVPYAPESGKSLSAVDPPSPLPSRERKPFERLAGMWDAAERDRRNRKLGEAGEWLVFEDEKQRLFDAGAKHLANKVEWTSKARGDGTGYDITSFSITTGEKRLLEVKTTQGGERTPFALTANELKVSEKESDVWRLVRLYDFGRETKRFDLAPPLDQVLHFQCRQWSASP